MVSEVTRHPGGRDEELEGKRVREDLGRWLAPVALRRQDLTDLAVAQEVPDRVAKGPSLLASLGNATRPDHPSFPSLAMNRLTPDESPNADI